MDELFHEQTNIKTTFNGKRYVSMFCSMYVVTVVTTSSLTETILIAMLFPFCCHVSTTCKLLCCPITPKFKELYKKKAQKRDKLLHYFDRSTQQIVRTLMNVYVRFSKK